MSMSKAAEHYPATTLHEARVAAVAGEQLFVQLVADRGSGPVATHVALPAYQPTIGDRVLVQEGDTGRQYIVGVVHAARGAQVVTAAGASATVDQEQIALRDAEGSLLAVYDAASGELVLSAPEHLKLRSPGGRLSIEAESMTVKATAVQWAVGHWDLSATRIVDRARDAFHSVEGILETRARRVRTLVDRTLELTARRTSVTSKEDTRIDGKRVLLG